MKKIRILLVGGGSGGHIYPLIAVAQKLQRFSSEAKFSLDLRYFGDAGGYEGLLVFSGIKCDHIFSSKLRRYWSINNIIDFFKFFAAFFQSIGKIFWFMPDAVFSKGGPGSLPILLACRLFIIPVVVHESDTVPGLTNLITGKISRKIFLAFDSASKYFTYKNVEVVGNPVRNELIINDGSSAVAISDQQKKEAKKEFKLDPEKPVLLVVGGSQGAAAINDFIMKNLEALTDKFQILHQVGAGNFENYNEDFNFLIKALPESVKKNYRFYPYFAEGFKIAYSAADLVLTRAGSGTIFELAYFGRPSVLVPLPDAANDHQILNAIEYEKSGAAITIQQENFLSHLVIDQLRSLIYQTEALDKMSKAAMNFYKPFSDEKIASYLLSISGIEIK